MSSMHELCFMMKSAFKIMDTCLWYLDSGCSRNMTGDRSLFKVFESKKGGNATFGEKGSHLSTWIVRHCKCSICRRSESELETSWYYFQRDISLSWISLERNS